jgi:hypothetical protein
MGKVGTGICLILAGKMEFYPLGLGCIITIENGNGIKICGNQPLGRWDLCSWTLGFS